MNGIYLFLLLLLLGFVFGRVAEKRHFRQIVKREAAMAGLPVVTSKALPVRFKNSETRLVSGNVVVSIDYFKKFLAAIKSLVGGQLGSYETLLDRARREAVLRMKEDAVKVGGKIILNARIETASIYKFAENRYAVGSVEVVAYGTAVIH